MAIDANANCRALTVLCAAAGSTRLAELKRAAVAAEWELVGGAASLDELTAQLGDRRPHVVVVDASLGAGAVERVRTLRPEARIVGVGGVEGADTNATTLEEVRGAILGTPRGSAPLP